MPFRSSPSCDEILKQNIDLPIIHCFHPCFWQISNFDENQIFDNKLLFKICQFSKATWNGCKLKMVLGTHWWHLSFRQVPNTSQTEIEVILKFFSVDDVVFIISCLKFISDFKRLIKCQFIMHLIFTQDLFFNSTIQLFHTSFEQIPDATDACVDRAKRFMSEP